MPTIRLRAGTTSTLIVDHAFKGYCSCYDTLLIMLDDMLIIYDVLQNHLIMKVIVTTKPLGTPRTRGTYPQRDQHFPNGMQSRNPPGVKVELGNPCLI